MKDGKVHVYMCGGQYAPCGVKVSSGDFREEIQSSCGDDFERVTCPQCMALVARMVRLYREATRGRVKWSENFFKNVAWDKRRVDRSRKE